MIWEQFDDFDPDDYSWNIDDEKIYQSNREVKGRDEPINTEED